MYKYNLELLEEIQACAVVEDLATIQDMMRWAYSYFNASDLYYGHGYDNAWDEAQQLVLAALYLPADVPEAMYQSRLTLVEKERVIHLIETRLGTRQPVAYLTNSAWFCGSEFYVDERTIVPRSPIGELIMQKFAGLIDHEPKRILDMCTGSGCIAIACAQQFLEAEVGFYRTDFFYYIYKGLCCFMNMSNNHNIIIEDYNNTFTVYPLRNDFEQAGYKIVQISDRSYGVTIRSDRIKIWVDNKMSFKPTKVYVNADSSVVKSQQNISRKAQTIRKLTNIPHLDKEGNVRYEFIELTVDGFVDNKFCPFTVIVYLDTNNERREYRLIKCVTQIQSGDVSYTYLKGYRILDREDDL